MKAMTSCSDHTIHTSLLVSVAMASFNGEKYIAQQLESIINQSYGHLEIVITDDASTDSTVAIVEGYQKRFDFIRLFRNTKNLGITPTFEHSFRQCRGDFIAICDQDDIWASNKIECLINAMEKEDVVYSNSALIDRHGRSLNIQINALANLRSFYSGTPFLAGVCLPGHTMVLKAAFLKSILPIPIEIIYDRWICFCAAGNNGIKYVDRPLVSYRQHESNSFGIGKSKNKSIRKTASEKFNLKRQELELFVNAPIHNKETKQKLRKLLELFTRKISIRRSIFFFKNMNDLLVIKKKNRLRKILFCMKMFFKPCY